MEHAKKKLEESKAKVSNLEVAKWKAKDDRLTIKEEIDKLKKEIAYIEDF